MNRKEIIEAENYLKVEGLPLSAHTLSRWRFQFEIMERYYQRSLSARDSIEEFDFLITFFQNCFHLKDWIRNGNKSTQINWEEKFKNTLSFERSMRVCRDICNGTKHLKVSTPSVDPHFSLTYEFRPFASLDKVKKYGWSIFIKERDRDEPTRYYLEQIAAECYLGWKDFVNRNHWRPVNNVFRIKKATC